MWFYQRLVDSGMPELDLSGSVQKDSQYLASVEGGHYTRYHPGNRVISSDGNEWYPLPRMGDCVVLSRPHLSPQTALGIVVPNSSASGDFRVESFSWPTGKPLPMMAFADFVMSSKESATYYYLSRSDRSKIWKMETSYWENFSEGPTYVNFQEGLSVPLLKSAEPGFPYLISQVLKSEVPVGSLKTAFTPEHFAKVEPLVLRYVDELSSITIKPKHPSDPGLEVSINTTSVDRREEGTVHVSRVRAYHRRLEGKASPREICQLSRLPIFVPL